MALNDKFDDRVGVRTVAVTALANAGTATISLGENKDARFVAISEDGSGNVAVQGASTFTVAVNRTTGVVTITNASGGAYTGTYSLLGIY